MIATGAPAVSRERALTMVKNAETAFGQKDVPTILAGFTDDIVIHFADQPEIRGKAAAKAWLEKRFARQRDYRLTKTLRMLAGDMIGNSWEGEWEDPSSGKIMKGYGVEFWVLRGDRVAVWDASFNVWEKFGTPREPLT